MVDVLNKIAYCMCNGIDALHFAKPFAHCIVRSVCRLAWIGKVFQREHESTSLSC